MANYLFQISYSAEAWAALIKHPQDRVATVSKVVEKLGGKVGSFWMAFGDYDLIGVLEMPDNISAAAFAVAVAAGGACKNVKTTPLLSIADGLEAMKRAGTSGYKPVTAQK
ncbi:MAG: GYD domain-containing protein [Bryobacteraceae bacterium]